MTPDPLNEPPMPSWSFLIAVLVGFAVALLVGWMLQ